MSEPIFQIGAEGIDTEQIVRDIQAAVQEKVEAGIYPDETVAKAERHNLQHLENQDEFMDYYMNCLRQAAYVDINEFEIRERRGAFAPVLIALKKVIWKLLVFYTYRLWSQQNQVNGLVVAAVDGMDRKQGRKIQQLEARIAELEKKLGDRT
jgi:predicted Ser/Thr protein kinase